MPLDWLNKLSVNKPLLDVKERLIACIVANPNDPSYKASATNVSNHMQEEATMANFHPKDCHHRRGDFAAINVGVTHGKGTQHPVNLSLHHHSEMVGRLLQDKDVIRLATFMSSASALPFHPLWLI
jgi:hypothetical protein